VELARPLSRAAGERPQAVIRRFLSLPARPRCPRLIEIATALASEPEAGFEAGLEHLLAGLSRPELAR
jgi:hypothetical protein